MAISPDVLEVIVDPVDRQPLQYIESEACFYNERTRMRYAVEANGIAVLLADGAESVSDDEHKRLTELVSAGKSLATGAKG